MIKNVIEYLEFSARKYPDKVALVDEKAERTFSQVLENAKKIAQYIAEQCGTIKNRPIAVYMEKSVYALCAFLGIVYSGNFYCPLDVKSPKDRCLKILDALEPEAVFYFAQNDAAALSGDYKMLYFEEALTKECCVDLQEPYQEVLDADPLYVLFTSGSTGQPKGVVISHKSVIDYAEWLSETFGFNEKTVFGNQAPFFFDNSILDIYSTMKNGSTLVIIPENVFAFPKRLLEYLQQKQINTIFWVPSALIHVANSNALSQIALPSLQKVLFCGEVMPNKQLNIWRKHYPDLLYANLYGPTEITDVCTYYIVDRNFSDDETLPIGKPCRNTQVLVLDNDNHLVTDTVSIGELCVRGTCISMGYYGDWEKTNAAFVQNPLNDKYRDFIYRTGDLVKYNEYGEILYICRKDFQIKHQGHRIELGEIETAASSIDGILQSCALYDEQNKVIVLFVNVREGVTDKIVYQTMKNIVPKYMLPGKIHLLERFPMTGNGKIDRVALKKEWI